MPALAGWVRERGIAKLNEREYGEDGDMRFPPLASGMAPVVEDGGGLRSSEVRIKGIYEQVVANPPYGWHGTLMQLL